MGKLKKIGKQPAKQNTMKAMATTEVLILQKSNQY